MSDAPPPDAGDPARIPPEQLAYARWLEAGTRIGFVLLLASFIGYLTGVLPSAVPLEDLPRYWGLPVDRYVAETGAPVGWQWVGRLGEGEYANLLGIAVLAASTIVCYAVALVALLRRGDRLYAAIAALEIALLLVAASGLVDVH